MNLLQVPLPTVGSIPTSPGALGESLIENPAVQVLLIFGIIVVAIVAGLIISRYVVRLLNRIPASLHFVVLRITLPRENVSDQRQGHDATKEVLAQAETLYLNLGGIKPPSKSPREWWNNFWYGTAHHLAFEIVALKGSIVFYAAMPRDWQRLVELQIHAQYPRAHIEELEDYNIFGPQSVIAAASLKLTKSSMFQLRTYRKLDSDPLNAVTNALAKLRPDEGAAIQLLLRPAGSSWQKSGRRVAEHMQHGKSLNEAMSAAGAGGFRSVASLLSPKKKNAAEDRLPAQLTPMQQELVKSLEEKASKHGFVANLRLVVAGPNRESARANLMNLVNAYSQYTAQESGVGFKPRPVGSNQQFIRDFIYRRFDDRQKILLNTEEVTSLFHLPLPTTETPNILWLQARKAPAPPGVPKDGLLIGHNLFRGISTPIRLGRDDRRRHTYIIGMTGSGKSTLMEEMVKQDIRNGEGVCVVDPHGSFVDAVLRSIPKERAEDVVLFDPSDTERPMGLNMLEADTPEEQDFAVQEMIAIFYKLFPPEMIGPMFEHNMRNAMLTLMADKAYPGTIADIPRMFTDKEFQKYKVSQVTDPVVRAFWEKEMAKTTDFHKSEMLGYLISKVGRFVENAMMRNIIGQPRSGFNFREVMDEGKILLVNLSKGKVGEVNASLLGLIIVSKLQMAALARANQPESQRRDFYLYLDEFQNFITDSIATILSEARKYKLNLTMAHQYMGQLLQGQDAKVRDAVLGNVGTMIAFRIGVEDAEILEKQFAPVFDAYDLVNQDRFTAYVKLLINNSSSVPFSMQSLPPTPGNAQIAHAVSELSHVKYGQPRAQVERDILERSKLGEPATAAPTVPAEPSR